MNKVDLDQLAALFESRFGFVLKTARRYAPKSGLDRDIAQQAFIVFVRGVAKNNWDLDRNIDPLLYGIVKNVALQHWDRERKHSPDALIRLYELLGRLPDEAGAPPEAADFEEKKRDALKSCMEKLTTRNRLLLEQHYREGIKTDELAARNNVKGGALRQLFCRLRAKLRDCIEQTLSSDEPS